MKFIVFIIIFLTIGCQRNHYTVSKKVSAKAIIRKHNNIEIKNLKGLLKNRMILKINIDLKNKNLGLIGGGDVKNSKYFNLRIMDKDKNVITNDTRFDFLIDPFGIGLTNKQKYFVFLNGIDSYFEFSYKKNVYFKVHVDYKNGVKIESIKGEITKSVCKEFEISNLDFKIKRDVSLFLGFDAKHNVGI